MDLRVTSGWFFLLLGVILLVAAFGTPSRAPMTTINVNLYSGGLISAFGGVMLWLGKRHSS
jgi:hypothetical protein